MKLRQLMYVLAIADSGLSMTAAASRVFTSQPGISKQLKLLETELGVQLFVRKGRSIAGITPAGLEVIHRARMIMREVDNIRAAVQDHCPEQQPDGKVPLRPASGQARLESVPPAAQRRSANPHSHCSMPPDAGRAGYARIADARTKGHTRARLRGTAGNS